MVRTSTRAKVPRAIAALVAALLTAFALVSGVAGCSTTPKQVTLKSVLVVEDGSATWADALQPDAILTRDVVESSTWLATSPDSVADRLAGRKAHVVVIQLPGPTGEVPDTALAQAVVDAIAAAKEVTELVVVVSEQSDDAYGNVIVETALNNGAIVQPVGQDGVGVLTLVRTLLED